MTLRGRGKKAAASAQSSALSVSIASQAAGETSPQVPAWDPKVIKERGRERDCVRERERESERERCGCCVGAEECA